MPCRGFQESQQAPCLTAAVGMRNVSRSIRVIHALCRGPQTQSPKQTHLLRTQLIIIAVEQKGLQATRKKMGPLLKTQSCEFLEQRPGSPHSAGATPVSLLWLGNQKLRQRVSTASSLQPASQDGALRQVAQASEPGIGSDPQAASEDWSRGKKRLPRARGGHTEHRAPMEENQPGASQSSRIPAARGSCWEARRPGALTP